MKKLLLFALSLTSLLFPQLKEMEVKPTENRGGIPIFRDYPDKAGVILYTQYDNLTFYSSYGIHKVMGDPASGKYVVIIEPAKQSLEVRCPGHRSEMIKIESLQPRDVLYFEVLPKKDDGIQGVTEVGITVQVIPSDAIILLDGKPFTNNTTTKILIGSHRLKVEKTGYKTFEQEITVTPEQTFFKIDLERVLLSPVIIKSNPTGASVFINNENKGTTELGLFLFSGIYDLRIELTDYLTINEKITVVPASETSKNTFNFTLKKDKGNLQLTVIPSGARVTLNRNIVSTGNLELSPGKYILEASADKYDSFGEEIEVVRGETVRRDINLQKNTGTLSLTINPQNAVVSINKERKSGTIIEMSPGTYELEVTSPGYNSETETIQIEKGKTVTKSISLKQKTGTLQFTIKPLDAKVVLSRNGVEKYSWNGIKLLDNIPEGTYDLTAKAQGHKTYTARITISENQTSIEDIQMTVGSDSPEGMVLVEGGTFHMGSNDGESDEKPVHSVTVGSFLIGKYEVTQELWESVMGSNPSEFKGSNRPVDQVSWGNAVQFCNKLSEKEGLQKAYSGSGDNITCDFNSNGYRLPTEAEWEYAARGGNKSRGYKYSGSNSIDEIAWYSSNSGSQTKEVGKKQSNELDKYDMSGNVWEWCWDWYGDYSTGSQTNPGGTNSGSRRVLRGGGWYSSAGGCRVAYRFASDPGNRFSNYGFRLVRTR